MSTCYGSIPLTLEWIVRKRNGCLSTLYHSFGFDYQERVLLRIFKSCSKFFKITKRLSIQGNNALSLTKQHMSNFSIHKKIIFNGE